MKQIKIRNAKKRDTGLFRKLWSAYLEECVETKTGIVIPSKKNLDVFTQLFELYVNKQVEGVVYFVAQNAVLMWGGLPGDDFETIYGKKGAQGWGDYVTPDYRGKGIATKMKQKAMNTLYDDMGFDYIGGVLYGDNEVNRKAAETVAFSSVGYIMNHTKEQNK